MNKQNSKPESYASSTISEWDNDWPFVKENNPKLTRKQYNRLLKDHIFLYKKTGLSTGEIYGNQYYWHHIDVKKLVRLIRKQRRAERLCKRMTGMK